MSWELYCTIVFLFYIFGGHKSFSLGHWYPCCGHLVMSSLVFKARLNPLHAFSLVWSSDSPLVQHLLTVQGSVWQLGLFDPGTCRCVCKHWWMTVSATGSKHSTANHSATPARHVLSYLKLLMHELDSGKKLSCSRLTQRSEFCE